MPPHSGNRMGRKITGLRTLHSQARFHLLCKVIRDYLCEMSLLLYFSSLPLGLQCWLKRQGGILWGSAEIREPLSYQNSHCSDVLFVTTHNMFLVEATKSVLLNTLFASK